MNKFSKLLNKIEKFHKKASLRSDMAKRILYSILPALAPGGQIVYTGGAVDVKALKAAIEGTADIIKFGVKACVSEMQHSRDDEAAVAAEQALQSNDYSKALDICIENFSDRYNWSLEFGGEAWAKIAKNLKKMYDLRTNLITAKQNNDYEAEFDIMKQIVVELNVFDGLTHNTDSIIQKLIKLETEEQFEYADEREPHYNEEINQVKRLMDSKELRNHMDVYHQIEPTLEESGDINRFKDWTTKLRSTPEYRKKEQNMDRVQAELNEISFRKTLIQTKSLLSQFKSQLNRSISDTKYPFEPYNKIIEITNLFDKIADQIIINKPFTKEMENLYNILSKISNDINEIIPFSKEDIPEEEHQLLKKLTNLTNKGIFLISDF